MNGMVKTFVALALGGAAASVNAAVVYQQGFGTGTDSNLASFGWTSYQNVGGGILYVPAELNKGGLVQTNVAAVGAADDTGAVCFGAYDGGAYGTWLMGTDAVPSGLLSQDIQAISMDTKHGTNTGWSPTSWRAALKIGGVWYASGDVTSMSSTYDSTVFTIASQTWYTVDSATLALGGAVSLPDGAVQSMGARTEAYPGWERWGFMDNYAVTAIPEPATMLFMGLPILLCSRRRSARA